jgi:hypothetical protein
MLWGWSITDRPQDVPADFYRAIEELLVNDMSSFGEFVEGFTAYATRKGLERRYEQLFSSPVPDCRAGEEILGYVSLTKGWVLGPYSIAATRVPVKRCTTPKGIWIFDAHYRSWQSLQEQTIAELASDIDNELSDLTESDLRQLLVQ